MTRQYSALRGILTGHGCFAGLMAVRFAENGWDDPVRPDTHDVDSCVVCIMG